MQSNPASGWRNHFLTTNYDLTIGTRKYLKATGNEETGARKYVKATGNEESGQPLATKNGETSQPPVQSDLAGGRRNHCWTTHYDLSIGIRKYLKATGNEETGQPPVQSNWAGGWGNHCRTLVY
ncbi:unnamed protein product [Prunus armeniaca]